MDLINKRVINTRIANVLMALYVITDYIAIGGILPGVVNSVCLYCFVGWMLFVSLSNINNSISRYTTMYFILLVFSAFSTLYSRYQCTNLYNMVVILILTFSFQSAIKEKNDFIFVAKVFAIAGTMLMLCLTIMGKLFLENRLGADITGNANSFSVLLLLSSVFTAWLLICNKTSSTANSVIWLSCLLFQLLGIALSGGRKILIAIVAFVIYAYYSKQDKERRKQSLKKCVVILIVVLVIYFAIMNVPVLYNSIGHRFQGRNTGDVKRLQMLKYGFPKWLSSPIWGYGLDNFMYYNHFENNGHMYYAHNNFLELLFDLGIIGFTIYYRAIIKQIRLFSKRSVDHDLVIFANGGLLIMLIYDLGSVSFFSSLPQVFLSIIFTVYELSACKDDHHEKRLMEEI